MSRVQDAVGVIKGLQKVAEASLKLQEEAIKHLWQTSSFRPIISQISDQAKAVPQIVPNNFTNTTPQGSPIVDATERFTTVLSGVKEFAAITTGNVINTLKVAKPAPLFSVNIAYDIKVASYEQSGLSDKPQIDIFGVKGQIGLVESDRTLQVADKKINAT